MSAPPVRVMVFEGVCADWDICGVPAELFSNCDDKSRRAH